jgi:hypothetical protein
LLVGDPVGVYACVRGDGAHARIDVEFLAGALRETLDDVGEFLVGAGRGFAWRGFLRGGGQR